MKGIEYTHVFYPRDEYKGFGNVPWLGLQRSELENETHGFSTHSCSFWYLQSSKKQSTTELRHSHF